MSSTTRKKIKTLLLSVVQDEVVSIKNGLLLQQKLFYIYKLNKFCGRAHRIARFFLTNLASSETKQRPKIELKNAKAQQKGVKNLRK